MNEAKLSRRIPYAGSVHGEEEIDAVVEVLRAGPGALRIGKHVAAMEGAVAELFGKRRGVMCNSGSSALYLAVELLDLEEGDEVITSSVTFSTDLAPLVRSRLVPAFVDVTPDTFQIDVEGIEEMLSPRTRALLVPNLIGNAPDWDRIRAIADRHDLSVIEDSCDALGLTLRGTPTGLRSDVTVTSFALSHIITAAGTGGMVCLDDDELVGRALLLRRWGRRSEVQLFGSRRHGDGRFFSAIDGGLEYDNLFIFDELGWNFEPSELSAAFGRVQLDKLANNLARRRRSFELTSAEFARHPEHFVLPKMTEGVESAWHLFPVLVAPHSTLRRADFQRWMEGQRIDTRMVWSGNATRQPAFARIPHRVPEGGLPNADVVMERGLVFPNHHAMTDEDSFYLGQCVEAFLCSEGLSR